MEEEQIFDNRSTKSRHNSKICAYCGKQEGKNWNYHCKAKHTGNKKVWDGKSELLGTPWCINWLKALTGTKAENIHPSFKPGFKKGNNLRIQRSSKASSVGDSSSVYQETEYNES